MEENVVSTVEETNNGLLAIDFIVIALFLVWAVSLVVALALNMRFSERESDTNDPDRKSAIIARRTWLMDCIIWQSVYYLMIIGSVICTLIVLYISCYMDMNDEAMTVRVFIYSAISIVFGVIPYMVSMKDIADAYHTAYRKVYECLIKDENLRKALIEGEDIIRGAYK